MIYTQLVRRGTVSNFLCYACVSTRIFVWVDGLTCIPGGDGSLRTNIRISCLLASRARTASWCVAWRRSMVFTSNIRSPTRSPLSHARPWGITWWRDDEGREKWDAKTPHKIVKRGISQLLQKWYLRDEHPRFVDAERVTGMITASHDAQA